MPITSQSVLDAFLIELKSVKSPNNSQGKTSTSEWGVGIDEGGCTPDDENLKYDRRNKCVAVRGIDFYLI